MKLFIKFMVSLRCKLLVRDELEKLGHHPLKVSLGEVVLANDMNTEQLKQLEASLLKSGLELMDDENAILIKKIKSIIIEMVHYSEELPKGNFSEFLCEKLNFEYDYLAGQFSHVTGVTIEHYIIAHKIERAKDLLIYDKLSLTEISYILNYSSVAHLSYQFKKVTGLTPTFFKKIKLHKHNTQKKV